MLHTRRHAFISRRCHRVDWTRAFGARVLNAQAPLEALHQRLVPVFELAGVAFTDADETRSLLKIR
jgi:hypothetical protein